MMPQSVPVDFITLLRIRHNTFELQENYNRIDVKYKELNGTGIETAILVSKSLSTKKTTAPIIVHFHGGGLIVGTNPDPAFLSDWLRELPVAENAILVSPAYRLAPEARVGEILDDIRDFWIWLHQELPCVLGKMWPNVSPDLNRILTVGESAGGYAALQSAFLFNTYAKVKAVIAQYPACYPDIQSFNPCPAEVDPTLNVTIDSYINNLRTGAVRTQSPFPELGGFLFTALAAGRFRELWGSPEDRKVATLEYALSKAKDVPPIWIIQGDEDSFVPKTAADELVDRIRKAHGSAEVKYTVHPGDHGFDFFYDLSSAWVKEGLSFVKKSWLEKH